MIAFRLSVCLCERNVPIKALYVYTFYTNEAGGGAYVNDFFKTFSTSCGRLKLIGIKLY